ncbi:MAG: DNA-binding response regulator [Bacillales bacterium]|jgi:DNA-binding response OmpR family regulator|nr:DNA-binding response regulator [Bacillales bacterium]
MKKILIIDDEERMLDLISLYLSMQGYSCMKATSGMQGLEILEQERIDLVLLDAMMPEMDGWETCKEIRSFSEVPVILVTARHAKEDIVKGLSIGADDYITKPFDEKELIARIEAILRRVNKHPVVECNGLLWDEEKFSISFGGKSLVVTPKEFALIGKLIKNPNKVLTRDQLIESLWDDDTETEGRTIDSHIRNIREKLRVVGFPVEEHLKTVWGIGYKWVQS